MKQAMRATVGTATIAIFAAAFILLTGHSAAQAADRLVIEVLPVGAKLVLTKSVLGHEWNDLNVSDGLAFPSGTVSDKPPGGLVCGAGDAVITLKNASWDMPVLATGAASCDQCTGTPTDQSWKVLEADKAAD